MKTSKNDLNDKNAKKRTKSALIVALVTFVVVSFLNFFNVFSFLENKTYDFRIVKTADRFNASEEIYFIVVDQDSIDWAKANRGWGWPWPRAAWAEIIDFCKLGNANSIAFDVAFTEPSVYGEDDDKEFARAAKEFGSVVQILFCSNKDGNVDNWLPGIKTPITEIDGLSERALKRIGKDGELALFPIRELAETAGIFGNVTSCTDSDNVIRRGRLFFPFDNKCVPSLGVAGIFVNEKEPVTMKFNRKNRTIDFMDRSVPVDKNGTVLLRYRDNIGRYAPQSAMTIFQSYDAYKRGEKITEDSDLLDPSELNGKFAFLGYYATGLFDICTTPFTSMYPGVGVHLTLLDNLIQGDYITQSSHLVSFLMILITSLIGSFIMVIADGAQAKKGKGVYNLVISVLGIVLSFSLLIYISFAVFIKGYWIPLVAPMFACGISYLASVLWSYGTEGKQKRYIKSAFKQYLSPVVIDQLLSNPDKLKLGGERREISIFFSDVQGFTSISERLSPEDLTGLLNDYLSAMSDIILESGGTIDKYEGDAIIAFWNAPIDQENHAQRALEAAMKCQKKLEEMREELLPRSGTPMLMRIGLNTGNAVVGNMGSHNRFDYTMLGDSVNLAARLEGLNKQFGTYTMCTKATADAAKAAGCLLETRELARVAVVGKKEAVVVVQPLFPEESEALKDILPVFNEARELFYEGSFENALKLFESIKDNDRPAFFYAEKCKELIANPPSEWAGVWKATQK